MAAEEEAQKKTERLHMLISPGELEAIDDWRFKNRVGTRSDAIRSLCQIAIALEPLVLELKEIWEGVGRADGQIFRSLLDATVDLQLESTEENLREFVEEKFREIGKAARGVVPANVELGAQAVAMVGVYESLKSGATMDESIEDLKNRVREIERKKQLVAGWEDRKA
jgi:hypothetical protein